MTLSFIPALLGTVRGEPSPTSIAPPPATDGPGFAALFLALMGGTVAAEPTKASPVSSAPATPSAGDEGDGVATPSGSSDRRSPGAARGSTEASGSALEQTHTAVPLGRTTTAGWAALAGEAAGSTGSTEAAEAEEAVAHRPRTADVAGPSEGPSRPDLRSVHAMDAGAAVASGAASADVRTPDSALSKLDPELREKVERVVERMASEHGREVRVVEGYRTPERQRWLYAQGRTRPGPVVTWTKQSRHMQGRAADLKVEGAWNQREAYAQLQTIARQEGLSTLGMKDPGHVELGGGEDATAKGRSLQTEVRADAPTPPRTDMAGGEGVARPARVAQVASVARPARVATPGAALTSAPSLAADAGARGEVPRATVESRSRGSRKGSAAEGPRETFSAGVEGRTASNGAGPAAPVGPTTGADPLGQVERIIELRDALANVDTQRVTVRLDGTAGSVDRIQVDLLDQALRGQVDVQDPELALRLRRDVAEILRVLEDKGYDAQSMAVKLSSAGSEGGRDGLAGLLRQGDAVQALRTILGTQPGSGGRDAHDRPGGQSRQDTTDQNAFNEHSRREDRRGTR